MVAANDGSLTSLFAYNHKGMPLTTVGNSGVIHISDTPALYYANVDLKVYKKQNVRIFSWQQRQCAYTLQYG